MNELRVLIVATLLAFTAQAGHAEPANAPPAQTPDATAGKAKPGRTALKKTAPKKKAAARKPARRATAPPTARGKALVAPKGETILHAPATITTGPAVLRDRDGNVIPTNPEAYDVRSATAPGAPRK